MDRPQFALPVPPRFSPKTAVTENVELRGSLVGDSHYKHRQPEYDSNGWTRLRDYDSNSRKPTVEMPADIGFSSKQLPSHSTDADSHLPSCLTESDISSAARGGTGYDDIYFKSLRESSEKEVHAACTTVDNLGFNFTQDIKGIFQQLTSVLQNSHAHFEKYHLQHPTNPNNDSNLQRKNEMINNLTEMLEKERNLNETQRELRESTIDGILNNHEIFKMNTALRHYKRSVMRRVFSAMRSNLTRKLKESCVSQNNKRTAEITKKLTMKHQQDKDKLNAEIASLKMQQAKERAEYEAAIQEGLMKGLRSLNVEAFKVMNLKVSSGNLASEDNLHITSSEEIFEETTHREMPPKERHSDNYFEAESSLTKFQVAKASLGKFQEARSSLSKFQHALMQNMPDSEKPVGLEPVQPDDMETRHNNSPAQSPRLNDRQKQIIKILNAHKKSSAGYNQKHLD